MYMKCFSSKSKVFKFFIVLLGFSCFKYVLERNYKPSVREFIANLKDKEDIRNVEKLHFEHSKGLIDMLTKNHGFPHKKESLSMETDSDIKKYVFSRQKNTPVDCNKLVKMDKMEIQRANDFSNSTTDLNYKSLISAGCKEFKTNRSYVTSSLTTEEENFPIAYSLLVFKDIQQTERLLRGIYRPQNYYCIHIDKKADALYTQLLRNISACFDNVFISSRSVDVHWGRFSVLEPELICMEDLWRYKKWKYFINLTGQEYPLRTNYELVKILKIYNGANDLEGTIKRAGKGRWEKAGPPPHGIKPTKGSVHITVNREFIGYILHNQTAKDLLEWAKQIEIPDETFFSTLNHNPQLNIRGSYKGQPETDIMIKPFLTRFKNWGDSVFNWECHGKRVRQVCVFGVEDLPLLVTRPEFFANKFYRDYQPMALDCLEEFHYNRTRDQYEQKLEFNTLFYEGIPFIKNIV